jgi:hypothetical protein
MPRDARARRRSSSSSRDTIGLNLYSLETPEPALILEPGHPDASVRKASRSRLGPRRRRHVTVRRRLEAFPHHADHPDERVDDGLPLPFPHVDHQAELASASGVPSTVFENPVIPPACPKSGPASVSDPFLLLGGVLKRQFRQADSSTEDSPREEVMLRRFSLLVAAFVLGLVVSLAVPTSAQQDTEMSALRDRVARLSDRLHVTRDRLGALHSDVDALTAKFESDLDSLNTKITLVAADGSDLEATVELIADMVVDHEGALTQHQDRITDHEDRLEALEGP